MLANTIKSLKRLLFMTPRVEGVQQLHFQVFIYVLNLFFQHDRPISYDLFFSGTDVCSCKPIINHNRIQSGGVKYQVTV